MAECRGPLGVTALQATWFSIICRNVSDALLGSPGIAGERRGDRRGAGALCGAGLASYLLLSIVIVAPCLANAASGAWRHGYARPVGTPVLVSQTGTAGSMRAPALAPLAPLPPAATVLAASHAKSFTARAPCT